MNASERVNEHADDGARWRRVALICNRCRRPMRGSTAYDGACRCGGLITVKPRRER